MISLFMFVSFGYSVISTKNPKPFHVAAAFAIVSSLVSFFFGGTFVAFLIGAVLLFIYTSAFYYALANYVDGIFMTFATLLGGALGLFFIPLMLAS